jgi:hypothetical protein
VGVFHYHARRAEEVQLEKARGNDALARAAEAEGLALARLDELARDYFQIAARERKAGNHVLAADAHERALVAAAHARAARANVILCGLRPRTHHSPAQHIGDG